MQCIYPSIFKWDDKEKVYLVSFPDIEGCLTFGYTKSDAYNYATDALNLMLSNAEKYSEPIPKASKLEDIKLDDKNSFAQYIYADTELYKEMLQLRKILDMKKRNKAKRFAKTTKNRRLNKIGNPNTCGR